MTNEKMISSISAIERALGKIEGVAFVLDDKYANPLLDAIEVLEGAVKEITDGN
jgi:hypothetical protein